MDVFNSILGDLGIGHGKENSESSSRGNNNDGDDHHTQQGGDKQTGPVVVYLTAKKTFAGPAVYATASAHKTQTPHIVHSSEAQNTHKVQKSTTPSPHPKPSPTPTTRHTTQRSHTSQTHEQHSSATHSAHNDRNHSSSSSPTATTQVSHAGSSTSSLDPMGAGVSASPSSSAPSNAPTSTGMSGGAVAGIVIGLIALIGLILAGVLFLYRKKKRDNSDHQRLDDEKVDHSSFPTTGAAAMSQSEPAPRLSIGRVSQFLPLGGNRQHEGSSPDASSRSAIAGGASGHASGAAAGASRGLHPADAMTRSGTNGTGSPWERAGERSHANDPANPFGNHAEKVNRSPPQITSSAVPAFSGSSEKDALAAAAVLAAGGAAAGAVSKQSPANNASFVPKPLSIVSTRPLEQRPTSPESVATASSLIPEVLRPGSPATFSTANTGYAAGPPASPAPQPENVHRVQMDFKPSMEDELELVAGQLVRMLHEYDDGWALCTRMDRSAQGVVPRTCLSKHAVKPRPQLAAPGSPRGPPPRMRGPPPPGAPPGKSIPPNDGDSSSPSMRPMGPPTDHNSPGPQRRPNMGLFPGPHMSNSPRQGPPGGRSRSGSVPRSASPGPYGASGAPKIAPEQRRRSNSMGSLMGGPSAHNRSSPPGASPLGQGPSPSQARPPNRKPVPGQAI